MRCLLINWTYCDSLFQTTLCEIHVIYFDKVFTKSTKFGNVCECTIMKVPSLHQGHETREVLLAVNTLHFEDADKRVAIDQYELYGVSGIVCCNGYCNLPYTFNQIDGFRVSLLAKFSEIEGGKTIDDKKNWASIINILRQVTKMVYTRGVCCYQIRFGRPWSSALTLVLNSSNCIMTTDMAEGIWYSQSSRVNDQDYQSYCCTEWIKLLSI
jgi:hypothetical protein